MGKPLFGPSSRKTGSVIPPTRLALAVRDSIVSQGSRVAAERLSLSDSTAARIAGRLPCHRASIELAARRLGIDLEDPSQSFACGERKGGVPVEK